MSFLDPYLTSLDHALRTLAGATHASRANPAAGLPQTASNHGIGEAMSQGMSESERRLAGGLMRVNHVGEVCAQALYQAQALSARSPEQRQQMRHAAREEADHLAWTQSRLNELGAHASWLNPLWYAGAFGIGFLAGQLGDRVSLGFVVETERQVEQHLAGHMDRLPAADSRSRAIVAAMQADERRHAEEALSAGAVELPPVARGLMRLAAKVMTGTARYI
jgi:3-demethoxyubiquinol 3-hydroxylase